MRNRRSQPEWVLLPGNESQENPENSTHERRYFSNQKSKPLPKNHESHAGAQNQKNLINRHFDHGTPYKVSLTDITYLPYGNGQTAYLSAVKDGATGEIVALTFL